MQGQRTIWIAVALGALGGCSFDNHGLPAGTPNDAAGPDLAQVSDMSPDQLTPDQHLCSLGQNRACYSGPSETAGVGECTAGVQACQESGWGPCKGEVLPEAESCDNKDNDCNGKIDDGLNGPVTREPLLAKAGPPDATQVCKPENLLKEDGAMVGLTFIKSSTIIDKQKVTACVRADFGLSAMVDELQLVARAVAATCGGKCTPPGCGKGRDFWVFTSEDNKAYKLLKIKRNIGTLLKTHQLPVGRQLRHVLICRGQHVAHWDHLEVDHLSVTYPGCPTSTQ